MRKALAVLAIVFTALIAGFGAERAGCAAAAPASLAADGVELALIAPHGAHSDAARCVRSGRGPRRPTDARLSETPRTFAIATRPRPCTWDNQIASPQLLLHYRTSPRAPALS